MKGGGGDNGVGKAEYGGRGTVAGTILTIWAPYETHERVGVVLGVWLTARKFRRGSEVER